ncbi:uncharacterized protein LOC117114894 [Anneissia japonica]|uniref:uncharacterized protein LOC117114894 n=1 Tax=Anneissia japonica TaxID=1529436 RepID=UPI001425AA5E|nr:uncharacterized protein LOC117114894 [Anneissia japonica]
MKFNNTLQKLDPLTDGQLMLHSDCASGFTEGIRKGHEYMVSVQSLPLPNRNGILTYISDESIFIGFCDSFSVTNGDVVPQVEGVYVNNEVVEVKCKPKHKLIGASALECLSPTGKGNWNDSIPECIKYHVEVEVFLNRSVLVNFEFLPNCQNGHMVRLRDLTHNKQPEDKRKLVKTGYTFMYENLTIGSWQACVSSYFCGSEVDYCHYFNITGPTTPAGPTTPTAPSTLVNTPKTLTSTKAKNPLKNTKTYVYSGVGCIGGLLLVVLVFRLRSSYKRDTSHTNLDESTITGSDRSLIVDNNNMMCVTPDLPLSHSLPDAITICSQSPTSVDIGIPPSGSV